MTRASIGAFVITFNRPQILRSTLVALQQQTRPPDHVLVVDNGDAARTQVVLRDLGERTVCHHSMGENAGPAAAEAYGLQRLCDEGYDWIYWVDDDDPPVTSDTVERLLELADADSHPESVAGVAAAGQRFDWREGRVVRLQDDSLCGPLLVDVVGGNGQFLLQRDVVRKLVGPDPRLFIDFEDTEYCLRLRRAGFRLLVDGELMHRYREHFGRLNLRDRRSPAMGEAAHRLWRRYYSTRNYIFAMREIFTRPDLAHKEARRAVGRSLWAWKWGSQYAMALGRYELHGVLDGLQGRMGRRVLPQPKY